MSVRTCVVVSLLATGLSEWVQLPVVERGQEVTRAPAWPGKYFNHGASPSRRVSQHMPPSPTRGTASSADKAASLGAVSTARPPKRRGTAAPPHAASRQQTSPRPATRQQQQQQHPVLVLTYSGQTPRVQFVRPAIFVGNHTLDVLTTPGPDAGVRQAKEGEAGLFGLVESPMDVLRRVHQSLKMQTPRSVLAKLKFLHDLRENLLFYVDQYLRGMWGPGGKRKVREAARRPSVEASFTTMSFLMFGAFTVQLVQKVISDLSGAGAGARGQRHRRSVEEVVASAKVMSYMDTFQMEMLPN